MKRFLIVEDDALSRKILEDFFSDFAECDLAEDGLEGFKLFQKSILDGKPYDLICTDIIMPKMDGHDLIRKIRACENSLPIQDCMHSTIFVISVSSSTENMTHALLDCDCDDYIVKPFQRDQMKSLLIRYKIIDFENVP